jgi:hypothetical protein
VLPFPKLDWNVKPRQVEALTKRYTDRATDSIQEVVSDAADFAAQWIKENKIYRGSRTGTLWHDFVNRERGNAEGARIETGAMYNSVGSTSAQYLSDGEYAAEFGIKLPSAGGRKYFMEQDQGFALQLASGKIRQVPGMQTFDSVIVPLRRMFRKEMLRRGFLRGKRDTRGERILRNEGFSNFNTAWADEFARTDAQRDAMFRYELRAAERRMRSAIIQEAKLDSYRDYVKNLGGDAPDWIGGYR